VRAFVEGVVAGLGIAVPVGAIAVLIVDLAMRQGFVRAVPAAMGAASADLAYATVAAIAGVAVASTLEPYERAIELVSAAVLVGILAYRMVRLFQRPDNPRGDRSGHSPRRTYAGFLALTLVNPLTVAYFAALILGLGDDALGSAWDKVLFVIGAFVASGGWQLVLAGAGALLHHRLPERARLATAIVGNALILVLAIRLALGA
jgi:threonine/homoserine/homoserine lactone efflux protein